MTVVLKKKKKNYLRSVLKKFLSIQFVYFVKFAKKKFFKSHKEKIYAKFRKLSKEKQIKAENQKLNKKIKDKKRGLEK